MSHIKKSLLGALLLLLLAFSLWFYKFSNEKNLIIAVAKGNNVDAQTYLHKWSDVNAIAYDGWTALTIASRNGDLSMVKWLLKNSANIDQPEGGGNTALFWASFYGHVEVAKFLIQKDADVERKCRGCKSPKEIAESNGHQFIVKIIEAR